MKWLRIARNALLTLIEVAIALEVLLEGRDPFREVAIALLVILYALLRLTGAGLDLKLADTERRSYARLVQLAKLLGAEAADFEGGLKALSDRREQQRPLTWITLVGCSVIFAAAVIRLLMAMF
jgi:hypothetical protein